MSIRRLLRKLYLRLREPPERASDVVRSYGEYLRLQRDVYLSHEADVEGWAAGLRRFTALAVEGLPRTSRVLDCACGDGVALDELRRLGFRDPAGVELASEKAARARALGFQVEERDMHDLGAFADGSFDLVLSSHTLEHAYEPARVLAELRRVLVPGGALRVVLPYPDAGAGNELAHAAKYELGTHLDDGGASVTRFFVDRGFDLESSRLDSVREPEIWLFLRKGR